RLARRHADAVRVVFDEKEQRQFLLLGKTDRLEKISLTRGGIADGSDDKIFLCIKLNPPCNSACRKKLRTGRRGHTPDVQVCIAVMRGHLAATTASVAFGKVFQAELARGHATPEHEPAVSIIRNDVI